MTNVAPTERTKPVKTSARKQSGADLMFTHHCGAPSYAIRLLTHLGLLDRKPSRQNRAVYILSSRWQDPIETDVAKLVELAREMRPRSERQGAAN